MARIEKTVFISYRRKDISWALAVYQYLTGQKYDVFFDFSSLSSGDFEQVIISNIRARAHFLLILTPTALDRCNEPGDWLRREIETAVDEQRNIIPLFFDGFNFSLPSVAEKMTGKIAAIKHYNGLDIPSGYFIEAMERLSERYLNVPLDAVIHPVSTEVRKAVKKEQIAVNEAIVRKWEDIKELVKPAEEKTGRPAQSKKGKSLDLRRSGIGAVILAVVAMGIIGLNALLPNRSSTITPTATDLIFTSEVNTEPAVIPVDTVTVEIETLPLTAEPTITNTPSATLEIGNTLTSPQDGMVMVYVPGGEFTMGLTDDEEDNPAHKVTLGPFWIDQTEVTNAMYAKCHEEGACDAPWSVAAGTIANYYGNPNYADFPVIYVSWNDARDYCTWAERRLPTEAEWEKAARGTDERIYPWGDNVPTTDLANHGGLVGNTTAVFEYPDGASPYGALNMAGNVWEWVADYYDPTYYTKSRSSNPTGPIAGDNRVMRGGSWRDIKETIRVIHRYGNYPLDTSSSLGFRCAMSIP